MITKVCGREVGVGRGVENGQEVRSKSGGDGRDGIWLRLCRRRASKKRRFERIGKSFEFFRSK